jgi:hypothetical protein
MFCGVDVCLNSKRNGISVGSDRRVVYVCSLVIVQDEPSLIIKGYCRHWAWGSVHCAYT